jgi:hypothetical protein
MSKSRGIHKPRAIWTEDQVETLRRQYPNFKTENVAFMVGHSLEQTYRKAQALGLKKTAEFLASGAAGRLDGIKGGATRFGKGHATWNKGMKGLQIGGESTQFRPGQLPHNTQPIGSLKVTDDGILRRKVSEGKGSSSKRWRAVHELVWIEANGPVPPKHIVVFKPGMKTAALDEITVDRVECITLAENMRRNTVHNYPKEIAQLVILRGALNRQINKRTGK